jgi:hypothetical protein
MDPKCPKSGGQFYRLGLLSASHSTCGAELTRRTGQAIQVPLRADLGQQYHMIFEWKNFGIIVDSMQVMIDHELSGRVFGE